MWLGERAIYASYFVVLVYAVSMVVTTLFMTFNVTTPLTWFTFDSGWVLRGEVWRVLTYGLVNPPSLGFVIHMVMIIWFGRDLEKFFGRRIFLLLFGGLYLLSPLLFTVIGLWWPTHLAGETGSFAIFVAFATLYPGAVLLFNILAKWYAIVLVGIYTLMDLADHDVTGLISLWATVGFAFGFVRYQQGRWALPKFKFRPRATPARPKDATPDELDTLLEKISQSGFGSLTPSERKKLEAHSSTLAQRQKRNPR